VKGWAIDRAGATLTARGRHHWSVTVGGDVLVSGRPEVDRPWRVAVVDPADPLRIRVTLALASDDSPVAVATSGNYERGRHIWDPRTGEAVDRGGSFTVVGPSMTYADAYATIGFVLGTEGLDWVVGHAGYAAVLVGADGAVTTAPQGLL
jgi:FAD:protein FMN transferase